MREILKNCKEEILYFLYEAEKCTSNECGFSAMGTTCAVIITIAEAKVRLFKPKEEIPVEAFFSEFVKDMAKYSSLGWFISNKDSISVNETIIIRELTEIRNGLSHQLSIPTGIALVTSRLNKDDFKEDSKIDFVICMTEFVSAVKETVILIINSFPNAQIDIVPGKWKLRKLGKRQEFIKLFQGVVTRSSGSSSG